jgi:hypothetical protein
MLGLGFLDPADDLETPVSQQGLGFLWGPRQYVRQETGFFEIAAVAVVALRSTGLERCRHLGCLAGEYDGELRLEGLRGVHVPAEMAATTFLRNDRQMPERKAKTERGDCMSGLVMRYPQELISSPLIRNWEFHGSISPCG